jgi:hypothetical protein
MVGSALKELTGEKGTILRGIECLAEARLLAIAATIAELASNSLIIAVRRTRSTATILHQQPGLPDPSASPQTLIICVPSHPHLCCNLTRLREHPVARERPSCGGNSPTCRSHFRDRQCLPTRRLVFLMISPNRIKSPSLTPRRAPRRIPSIMVNGPAKAFFGRLDALEMAFREKRSW